MPISEETYLRVAMEESDQRWELHCGRLVEKPPMTWEHGDIMSTLSFELLSQLERSEFRVHTNHSRARISETHYYVPDIAVIPLALARRLFGEPGMLEAYREPLPLVVEIWSATTGGYDVASKLPEYQRRGDEEIWYLHPYERWLIARRRQPDGSYSETRYAGGNVACASLPNVIIDLDALIDGASW